MLAIKLRMVGKKHQRTFRVIVAEKRYKLKGKFVEYLGWYNRFTDKFFLKTERVKHWLNVGAQPTDSVYNLLVTAKILPGPKKPLHKKSKKAVETSVKEDTKNQDKSDNV